MKRVISVSILFMFCLCMIFSKTSKATGTVDSVVNDATTEVATTQDDGGVTEDVVEATDPWATPYDFTANTTVNPPVTMEQAEEKVKVKGGEVLSLVQTVSGYIIAIFAVVGAVCLVIGLFGKKDGAKSFGFGALVICAIAYVLVFYGPWLLDWIRAWWIS